jgi:hypothetical protein
MRGWQVGVVLGVVAGILLLIWAEPLRAQGKATSLSDARAAVEANMTTAAGKDYDAQFGAEIAQKHLGPVKQCKQSAGGDLTSFWILFKLDKDGGVREMLLYPETKLGMCARELLSKDRFSTVPPRAGYWVSVYMKLSH